MPIEFQSFYWSNAHFWVFMLEPIPPTIAKYSILEWYILVYVISTTFIFNCYRFMDNPHFYMFKVHLIITTSFCFVSTLLGPIFLDLVFPFRWLTMELIGMFHDMLAFLRECVLLSTTPVVFLMFHLSSFFWFLEALDLVVVLIFYLLGQEQREEFPC
jgi:hypothetical protein